MRKNIVTVFTCLFVLMMFWLDGSAHATTCNYYVSNSTGNNSNNGTSESTPWRTIAYLNTKTIQPGQTVCFKSGDTWRLPTDAYLNTRSGSAAGGYVTYSAYGIGSKPLFLGSVEKNSTSNWTLTATPNVWATAKNSFTSQVGNIIFTATMKIQPGN